MEYCDGGNILTIQMKKGSMKLPYKEALNFMYQITLAVDYMHERQIVHRDIKNENIFIKNGLC